MAVFFYNIFLFLFRVATFIASFFNQKAKNWVHGRKHILENLEKAIPKDSKIIWVHCASLGEFEQGRPLIERLRAQDTGHKILLTFFSPSGYEVQKNYKGADWVFYLPLDGPRTAKRFLEIIHPSIAIFVKYEFWYYYLKKIKYRNIPLLLVSALFRKDMSFFQWYGSLQRKMLSRFDHLFVQNESSQQLIEELGLKDICSISGDTRFDRVIEIAEKFQPIIPIEEFFNNSHSIIAGSTWPEDEVVLKKAFTSINDPSLKLVIAPHNVNEKRIRELQELFPNAILYSQLVSSEFHVSSSKSTISSNIQHPTSNILIIDNVGMLSRLYRYGYITYVGGGFTKSGIHNVLEAAVYNKIVFFGPNYEKYSEAVGLVMSGGGISFQDIQGDGQLLASLIQAMLVNKDEYEYRSKASGEFVQKNKGATQKIINYIQEKRLLTN